MPARPRTSFGLIAAALCCQFAVVSAAQGDPVDPLNIPDTQLEPVPWRDLDGWAADDHAAAFATFRVSCEPLLRQRHGADGRPIHGALREVCKRAAAAGNLGSDKDKARAFFEDNFRPVRIARLGETTGLLTGYYEPIVDGSRFPNPEFHTPLYRRPRDLVVAGHKPGTGPVPNRGSVSRLNANKQLEPYYDRAAIEDGALDGQKLEICWVKDPFDAMTIQIQGSARVKLEDGTTVRINYDAHNGHSYTAVGRILIERNLVPRDEMSMERIKRWMQANPDQAKEVRATNRSYVFFRITGLSDEGEPAGAQGVPLTPGRSIAVDRTHVYGTPFFLEADLPVAGERPSTKFRRLMVAQDTGSAIVGPARADLYWGAGDDAGRIAGRIRQQGRFVVLIPRELDMVEAGKSTPLPPAKPAVPERNEAKKDAGEAKAKADKTDNEARKPLPKSRLRAERAARTKSKPRS
jgi:membrane-bound lytic murein transglycosylase A